MPSLKFYCLLHNCRYNWKFVSGFSLVAGLFLFAFRRFIVYAFQIEGSCISVFHIVVKAFQPVAIIYFGKIQINIDVCSFVLLIFIDRDLVLPARRTLWEPKPKQSAVQVVVTLCGIHKLRVQAHHVPQARNRRSLMLNSKKSDCCFKNR